MGRRMTARFAAFFLRRGWLTPAETMAALSRSHRHRSSAWHWAVLNDAQARNQERQRG